MSSFWAEPKGRELDATPLEDVASSLRIVACLNVWNDLSALKRTLPTWRPFVDHIIAIDGAYRETGHSLSTDGTREYLQSLPNVTLWDAAGETQCEKRTRYFQACRNGDTMFIVDADESIYPNTPTGTFRKMPICDVGWIRIVSPLYDRSYGQPRIIRWMPGLEYRGRHHWIYQGDALLCSHQYGGVGYAHRPVNITLYNQRKLGRSPQRLAMKHAHHERDIDRERVLSATPQSVMSDTAVAKRESLQILMHAYRDDGLAPSRLHTAINRTTPHSSIFVKTRPGPFSVPDQYLLPRDTWKLNMATSTADLIHFHGVMSVVKGLRSSIPTVFHHHGTLYRRNAPDYNRLARERNALVLLSNLELFSWTDGASAFFLPNTIPVARYAKLASIHRPCLDHVQLFRVAHSPSQPQRKGTDAFLKVCASLQSKGYPIEPVLIHDQTHRDALRMKATCHAMFDSFWLGMQCSGIEAAAMGMPVIAGDETVAQRYRDHFGAVPYTFAENEQELEYQLARLVDDRAHYDVECTRVGDYVRNNHDESAVALRYLDLLDGHFGWREKPFQKKVKVVVPARRTR